MDDDALVTVDQSGSGMSADARQASAGSTSASIQSSADRSACFLLSRLHITYPGGSEKCVVRLRGDGGNGGEAYSAIRAQRTNKPSRVQIPISDRGIKSESKAGLWEIGGLII